MPLQGKVMRIALGGFLEPIEHFERIGTVISVSKGIEHDKRNPPLQKNGYLPIGPLSLSSCAINMTLLTELRT